MTTTLSRPYMLIATTAFLAMFGIVLLRERLSLLFRDKISPMLLMGATKKEGPEEKTISGVSVTKERGKPVFSFRHRFIWFVAVTYIAPAMVMVYSAIFDPSTKNSFSLPYLLFMFIAWPIIALFVPAGFGLIFEYNNMSPMLAIIGYFISIGLSVFALSRKNRPSFILGTIFLAIFFLFCFRGCMNQRWN